MTDDLNERIALARGWYVDKRSSARRSAGTAYDENE